MRSLLGNISSLVGFLLYFCSNLFTLLSSSSIRLELLNRLNDLEELKIRSVSGLTLQHGLQVFSHLHKLKTLVQYFFFKFQVHYLQFNLFMFIFFAI